MKHTVERAVLRVALILLLGTVAQPVSRKLEARQHWWDLAQNELAAALNVRDNWNVAKNVIMFLGDGMGITANTAARIFKGQKMGMNGEEGYLTWERFPNAALLKTYNVDKQVPDSAATATAYLCGIKTNYYTLGVDPMVTLGDCAAGRNPLYHTPSILQWAQEAGKDTGIVTTTRITHATPGATYAHSAHRDWECDGNLGTMGIGCKDIADQLVHDNPGKYIKVILGGGRQAFGAGLGNELNTTCIRKDGRNLTQEWLDDKKLRGASASYVTNYGELSDIDPDETDYLLGLFADSHNPFEVDRLVGPNGSPSLKDMALKALKLLKKSENGFFLLVEGGRIDHALHDNLPHRALEEAIALDSAVAAVLKEVDMEETLVVVTADHSHVMTMNGYPDRGNDILGLVSDLSEIDNLPYTTLMFTNGPGYNYSVVEDKVVRHDPSTVNTKHIDYRSQAAVPTPPISETHGGEDVAIWAVGPMAHLFHRTHEQNYVAHAMAYSACIGPSAKNCQRPSHATFTRGPLAKPSVREPGSGRGSGEPKFPTLSPVLQQLLDDNQQKIVTALGTETVKSFSNTADVQELLGRSALPHSM
ncbi:alkaline phosphatase-like [Homarus americanus]|nr:alkaline phosphatase-like [Homarus americanus]XP_042222070.1 alkaline phosphatase-like [Homarus americanus]XP_042222072.1 alkaline phosphatase-like [Homarus americanus]XP_042222073.1 alkaline phosphatase-like [Homarus americanus]